MIVIAFMSSGTAFCIYDFADRDLVSKTKHCPEMFDITAGLRACHCGLVVEEWS